MISDAQLRCLRAFDFILHVCLKEHLQHWERKRDANQLQKLQQEMEQEAFFTHAGVQYELQ